jgi:hypothetical protein
MNTTTQLPWHRTRAWRTYLRDLLLYRGRMRYTLSVSNDNPLGGTDPETRMVYINPFATPFSTRVRHAPPTQDEWEKSMAVALVEHEAGHIRHSGQKPRQRLLGWLWNALEDERLERLQEVANPELVTLFEFLGDAVWNTQQPTTDLLAGCLLWRWEHDKPADERKFHPTELAVWEQVRAMVEAAWQAPTSDDVTSIAADILQVLGRSDDEPVPDHFPTQICRCGGGHAGSAAAPDTNAVPDAGADVGSAAGDTPEIPDTTRIPGGVGTTISTTAQGALQDPQPILSQVEGYARALALSLRPPCPHTRPQPHPSRGEFVFERATLGQSLRPFDRQQAPGPSREIAVLMVVDETASMGTYQGDTSRMEQAIIATMLLNRAAELAQITFGVWGFTTGAPVIHRPLARGHRTDWQINIASMSAYGCATRLYPSFGAALDTLSSCREQRKLLIVVHDGEIDADDARRIRLRLPEVQQRGILLQPIFVGTEQAVIDANRAVFGHVLACPSFHELSGKLSAWLRAAMTF